MTSDPSLSSRTSIEEDFAVRPLPVHDGTIGYMSEKSAVASTAGFTHSNEPRYFHSRRVKKGEVEKPWLENKDKAEKWNTYLPVGGIILGIIASAILVWDGLRTVENFSYCTIYEDDFSNGLDSAIWTKEVEVGGYGNGQFEWTTNTDENSYVKDGALYLKPTLQDASFLEKNGQIINLLKDGTCTGSTWSQCVISTNTTNGTIINPVKSARINTKKGKWIKYGRIEVEAKLPAGDWLWPAIWMLPVNDTYGPWPESGEIDIVESRGNNYTYPQGGNNIISSTLHWGPDIYNDGWYQTNYKRNALHTTFAKTFHTFGLEWSPKYLYTYIDGRLLQVGYTKFSKPFFQRGNFPAANSNGTQIKNPWALAENRDAAPFDIDFYLVLNVAVGGTNGWFQDGVKGKPWVDDDPKAKLEFWQAREQWYPTWKDGGEMVVRSIKMMQQKGYNGC